MREKIELVKGGKLIETYWYYDEDKEEGTYLTKDVTDELPRFYNKPCEIGDGVTLYDILSALKPTFSDLMPLLPRTSRLYMAYVSKDDMVPYQTLLEKEEPMDYLVLSNQYEECVYDDHSEVQGAFVMDFGGIGKDKNGVEINYAISLSPLIELLDIPVKVDNTLKIFRTDYAKFHTKGLGDSYWEEGADNGKHVYTINDMTYTLGQYIYSIFWELTWHGGPDDKEEFKDELLNRAREVYNDND